MLFSERALKISNSDNFALVREKFLCPGHFQYCILGSNIYELHYNMTWRRFVMVELGGVLSASWRGMFVSFARLGKISATIVQISLLDLCFSPPSRGC